MNTTPGILLIISLAGLLSACQATTHPARPSQSQQASQTSPEKHYVARRTGATAGIPLAATGNICVDNFSFLKEQQDAGYQKYTRDYSQISQGYTFLNVNKNIMDKDARNVYTMNLDIKLDTLCAKVRYSGFRLVKDKMNDLSGI